MAVLRTRLRWLATKIVLVIELMSVTPWETDSSVRGLGTLDGSEARRRAEHRVTVILPALLLIIEYPTRQADRCI